jgi:hypothetical protein
LAAPESRDVLPHVGCKNAVDEGLVADVAAPGFLSQLSQHAGIQSDRDELTRPAAKRRTADASHSTELLV